MIDRLLELLILETKSGHDGLYDEMLKIPKQLLSTNVFTQEQLENFLFMIDNITVFIIFKNKS